MRKALFPLVRRSARRNGARRSLPLLLCLCLLLLCGAQSLSDGATAHAAPATSAAPVQSRRHRAGQTRRPALKATRASRATQPTRARERRADFGRTTERRVSAESSARVFEPVAPEMDEDAEGRAEWFLFKRAYPFGSIPSKARQRAWDSRPSDGGGKGRVGRLAQQSWTPIGPHSTLSEFPSNWGMTSGRITAIAVHPSNPNIVLIGSAAGGIWRSTDGGANFAPTTDNQVDLAVGTIAFAPSQPDVVYAGMGDFYGYLGTGILKSTDAGQTWTRVTSASSGLPEAGFIAKLIVDPANAQHVYVAQSSYELKTGAPVVVGGLYISSDGGANWTKTFTGQPRGLDFQPGNAQTIYLTIRRFQTGDTRRPGVFKSTDGGQTWTQIYTSLLTNEAGAAFLSDIRLAVTPADPQRIYIYLGAATGSNTTTKRFEVSTNGGQTWTLKDSATIDNGQFGYNTYLMADPTNANVVYVGSRDIYKSTNVGSSWANITRNFNTVFNFFPGLSIAHPDQHALAFAPDNSNVLYIGNDGGLYKSTDAGASIQSLNATLSLTQFVGISLHPTDPSISYGGTQDNGTQRRVAGTNQWKTIIGGDGGHTVLNPLDPSIGFDTYVYGTIRKFTNNGDHIVGNITSNSTFGESNTDARIAFYAPLVGNGVDQRLYFGTWRLFVSDNLGGSWTAPAGQMDLTAGSDDVLSAIAVARSNTNVIYTGSAAGRVMVSTDNGATWRQINAGLPQRFIESITVDAANPNVAYLTVSGYGSGHVFKTYNGTDPNGATWTDISGSPASTSALPNIPVNALLVDPLDANVIYAGTDIGVFRSNANGVNWETFNEGLPPVPVTAFAAQPGGRIQLSTYGRGAYELTGSAAPPAVVALSSTSYAVGEGEGHVRISVTRSAGNGAASIDYATTDATASERSDYTAALGTLIFAPGETTKSFDIFVTDDVLAESPETLNVTLSNAVNLTPGAPQTATVTINSNDSATGANPVKDPTFDAQFFVRQHYVDFFNREPDAAGLAFWTNQINECESRPVAERQGCRELRRINVSAAFFLSIEFQETGYLVYRFYQAAFDTGEHLPLRSFLPDTQRIGRDLVVGQGNWQVVLESNKQAYAEEFVNRQSFLDRYPLSMSAAQFVDALNANTGGALSTPERDDLVSRLGGGQLTRGGVLRAVAENAEFGRRHKNRAFVLMQYFGYMRRNPQDAPELHLNFDGYNFWLGKLNEFGGDYIKAEMVKAFITSGEYQARFGQ